MRRWGYLLAFALVLAASCFGQQWEWARKAMITTGHQRSKDICVDKTGNVFITGTNYSQAQFDKKTVLEAGSFIAKYDKDGNLLWAKSIGGKPEDITTDSNGNFYLLGNFTGTMTTGFSNLISNGAQDFYLAKFDGYGIQQWARSYGGINNDAGYGLVVDKSGNSYLTGSFKDSISFDSFKIKDSINYGLDGQFFAAKVDPNGIAKWLSRGNAYDFFGSYLCLDKLQNVYIIGRGAIGPPCQYYCNQGFIIKYDSGGGVVYRKEKWDVFEGTYGLKVDNNFNIYTIYNTGSHYSFSPTLAKYDQGMNKLWDLYLGWGYGGYIIHRDLSLDSLNNIYLLGALGGDYKKDSVMIGSQWIYLKGNTDLLISKVKDSGNFIWTKAVGGKGYEAFGNLYEYWPGSMCVDPSGNCYLTGNYNLMSSDDFNYTNPIQDTLCFDNDTLTNDGPWSQIFAAKLKNPSSITTSVPTFAQIQNSNLEIYPNPSSGKFSLVMKDNARANKICVYDITGRCIYSGSLSQNENEIDLSAKERGTYFVEVWADERAWRKKLVVE